MKYLILNKLKHCIKNFIKVLLYKKIIQLLLLTYALNLTL